MLRYLTVNDGTQAIQDIKKIYQSQPEWEGLGLAEVALYAENVLDLKKQTEINAEEIRNEAAAAAIQFVPILIIDQTIFDEVDHL